MVQEQDGANLAATPVFFKKPLHIFDTVQVFVEFRHAFTLGVGVPSHSVEQKVVAVKFLEVHDERDQLFFSGLLFLEFVLLFFGRQVVVSYVCSGYRVLYINALPNKDVLKH